jgi:hypothetical protein
LAARRLQQRGAGLGPGRRCRIEALTAEARHLDDRAATERPGVALALRQTLGAVENPILADWNDSASVFSDNVADAMRATIMTLPWMAPIVLLIQPIRLLWRFLRRRGTERRPAR